MKYEKTQMGCIAICVTHMEVMVEEFRLKYKSEPKNLHVSPREYAVAKQVLRHGSFWETDDKGYVRMTWKVIEEAGYSSSEWAISDGVNAIGSNPG